MALTAIQITQAILASGSNDLNGLQFSQIAQGIGSSLFTWAQLPTNLALTGTTTGQAGAGVVNGTLTIPSAIPLIALNLSGSGINGITAPFLARAISLGLSASFSTAQYTGLSVGVAVGVDSSKVTIANPLTLAPLLFANLAGSFGGSGPTMGPLSIGLANGIVAQLLLGSGVGVVTGSPTPSPVPIVGTSPLSKVF